MPTRKHEIVNSLEAVKQYLLQTLEGTAEAVSTKDSSGSVTAAASVTSATNAAPALAATESERIAAMTPTATTSKLSATADVWQPKATAKAGVNNSVPVPTTTTAAGANSGEHTLGVSANTEGIAQMNGSSSNGNSDGVGSSVNSSSNGVSYKAEIAAAADKIALKNDEKKSLRLLTLSVFVGVVVVAAAVTLRSRQ
jgi:hypothetical protein